jgi:meso-butanediol dehydrogenase / (S,S)-butanediol dehydrogenase / diacetyl reductase
MGLLDGKVVIVTGATRGIGVAIATHLHDEGAAVLATGRSKEDLAALARSVGDSDRFATLPVDVTSENDVVAAIRSAVVRFGKLTGMVNNAGVLFPNDTVNATLDEYNTTFEVNVKGVFLGCKYAVPAMLETNGAGSIVNFGSINSLAAEKQLSLYTASKGAVLQLTRAVALDHAAQGIRANCLCPGFVDTELNVPHYTANGGRAALEAGLPEFQPIGRAIEPIEIAQSVAFLLSDSSSAITGTAFVVDGGVLSKA